MKSVNFLVYIGMLLTLIFSIAIIKANDDIYMTVVGIIGLIASTILVTAEIGE